MLNVKYAEIAFNLNQPKKNAPQINGEHFLFLITYLVASRKGLT